MTDLNPMTPSGPSQMAALVLLTLGALLTCTGCDDDPDNQPSTDMDVLDLSDVPDESLLDMPDLADCPSRPEPGIVCCRDGTRTSPQCDEGMLVCPAGYIWTNENDCFGEPDIIELDMGVDCQACQFDEVCVHTDASCGQNSTGTSQCEPRPVDCSTEELQPVCGCDGLVYANPCQAKLAGVDVWADGPCEPPAGRFQCGSGYCQEVGEYCQKEENMVETPVYTCLPIPDSCFLNAEVTCDCFSNELCGQGCTQDDNGNFILRCP